MRALTALVALVAVGAARRGPLGSADFRASVHRWALALDIGGSEDEYRNAHYRTAGIIAEMDEEEGLDEVPTQG